jgi:hypothetical protein
MRTRLLIAALVALLVLVFAGIGVAAAQEGGQAETTTSVQVDDGGAAVPAPPPEVLVGSRPWTARYLPATLVLLTVLVVGGAFAYNFFFIRGRYEVVD